MTVLDFDTAKDAAVSIVERQGQDFVYNPDGHADCAYVPVSDPRFPFKDSHETIAEGSEVTGCLVGEILKETGFLNDAVAGSQSGIVHHIEEGNIPVTSTKVRRFLARLQDVQDSGNDWGYALDTALSAVEEMEDL